MKKYIYIAIAILGLLGVSFILGKCSTKKERTQQIANLAASRMEVSSSSLIIAGLKTFVSEKDAIILTQKEAIAAGIIERERLRKLHLSQLLTNAELTGVIEILKDSLDITPDVQFITVKDTLGNYPAIRLPYKWGYVSEYVTLSTGIGLNQKGYFDLSVPFSGSVTIGYVRTSLFKTTPKGIFTTNNPYLKVKQVDVLIVQDKKKFYQKTWFHLLMGGIITESVHQIIN